MIRQPWKTTGGVNTFCRLELKDILVIPANWIMLRARRPSTAIRISKILFGGDV